MKSIDAGASTRVALLARSGVACERLQAALAEAGADVVLVADPSQTDSAGVRAAGAQAILIALEPLVDEALDRYDALLADPEITVIFDEAELAANREGWDAARWTRHLAAKLNRHQQVLPPGADPEFDAIAPAGQTQAPPAVQDDVHMPDDGDLAALLDEIAIGADAHGLELPDDAGTASGPAFLDEMTIGQLDMPGDVPATVSMDETFLSFDPTLAEFDAVPDTSSTRLAPIDFDVPAFEREQSSAIASSEGAAPGQADNKATKDRFRMDLDALELRIADMQLEELRPPPPVSTSGAILVMAGIGGPDAVRQLLAGLPATFPRAVLIQQRLEGARHDNLVRQMQRATAMPVRLAEAGAMLEGGNVYVLPTGMGIVAQFGSLYFDAGSDELISRLPATDSAVVLLSGADVSHVGAALALGIRGSLVAGQSPDGCFDAAASEALVARGGTSAAPAEIAEQLAARWPS
ncbi:chemotaxis protein CheB [Cognatiluteimonas profundi]|uniref:chemotaxis protein CheB n=1 Tax=Cognatiluteimonas profundi TaxID=2594501 RepID=UPI00131C2122|nr:chemotaxis protein CheB [Lysobacter profundi]